MLVRKPSERTNRLRGRNELTLTPLMDIITNLMFFLLIFANLIPVVTINAPLPKVASTAEEIKMAKNDENKLEVVVRISESGLIVSSDFAATRTIPRRNGEYLFDDLHGYLLQLHRKRPKVREITVIPNDLTKYDTIIRVMDEARELRKDDKGYKQIPALLSGKAETKDTNAMFPEVALGGV